MGRFGRSGRALLIIPKGNNDGGGNTIQRIVRSTEYRVQKIAANVLSKRDQVGI